MHVSVVYESLFGSTHQVAEAIAEGVREARPDAEVACLPVADADADGALAADLLIVGGPTHMRGMTFNFTRKMGVRAARDKAAQVKSSGHRIEPGAAGPGVREWFHALPRKAKGNLAAAFDTRVGSPMAGGAASGIARQLRRHGFRLTAEPEGFIVEGAEEPVLREGELDKAKAWGKGLVVTVAAPSE